jgi:D-alanyl-D-alanine carboxypeptidase
MLNTNRRFLNGFEGATGLKTGYTRAAGYNLAATANRNGMPLLSVVMGATSSPERFERTVALLNWGFQQVNPLVATQTPPPIGGQPLVNLAPTGIAEHHPLRAALLSPGGSALVTDIVSAHQGQATTASQSPALLSLPKTGGFRPILVAQAAGDAHWGLQIGLYPSRYLAEQALLATTLSHLSRLGSAPPSVAKAGDAWSAAYTHMSRRQAESACRGLLETGTSCAIFRYEVPGSETRLAAQP